MVSFYTLKLFLKIAASTLLYFSGILACWRRSSPRRGILILCYHRITDRKDDPFDMAIDLNTFEIQMRYLVEHYRVIAFDRVVECLLHQRPLPVNTVALTFDDGYADNFTSAFPVLLKYRLPAIIFLTVAPIDERSALWFDVIKQSIFATLKPKFRLHKTNGADRVFDLSNRKKKKKAAFQIVALAKQMNIAERGKLISRLCAELGVGKRPGISCEMLNWEQIREMHASGIHFGGHTLSHPILATISSDSIWHEIKNSKIRIEQELNDSVSHFSYPNGKRRDFNDETEQMIQQAGYQSAVTLMNGLNADRHVFRLKRQHISSQYIGPTAFFTKMIFAAEMSGIFDFLFLRKLQKHT